MLAQAVPAAFGQAHDAGPRRPRQPPEIAATLERSGTKRSRQVVAALRPVQTPVGNAVPPRPERGHIEAEHAGEPRRPRRGDVQALALGRGEQAAALQSRRDRNP